MLLACFLDKCSLWIVKNISFWPFVMVKKFWPTIGFELCTPFLNELLILKLLLLTLSHHLFEIENSNFFLSYSTFRPQIMSNWTFYYFDFSHYIFPTHLRKLNIFRLFVFEKYFQGESEKMSAPSTVLNLHLSRGFRTLWI